MYLIALERDTKNASNGRAQYRVKLCSKKWFDCPVNIKGLPIVAINKGALIETNKPYRVGNLINPVKALGKALIVPTKGK